MADVMRKHNTDKLWYHHYEFAYERFLQPYRGREVTLLEIGVLGGASFATWREYLPEAQLAAIDKDPACADALPAGTIFGCGDQGDPDFVDSFARDHGPFEIVIDDGIHWFEHQQISFEHLWPHVLPGGLYVIEDLHTAGIRSVRKLGRISGHRATIDVLFDLVRGGLNKRRRSTVPVTYAFAGNACFIVKPED
ncbi:class I SAM-dependent methyltransferase [bacterium]|nr:class I SAM-dependent methyltransferase [bacterium]